jgi:hypothetical protein
VDKLLSKNQNLSKSIKSTNPFECDELSNDDDYDYIEMKSEENKQKNNKKNEYQISYQSLMPHDKNAINFLVNEYLLEQNFKMTSVTFSEENESQDLDDWECVGLNRAKPPSICQLYKFYLNKKNDPDILNTNKEKKNDKTLISNRNEISTQTTDFEIQVNTSETNTETLIQQDFQSFINFDHDCFEV